MFTRIWNLIRGFGNLLIGKVEKQNPEMLIELEKENLRKQIANYNEGLVAHAAILERLMTQVKRLEKDQELLRAKITANLRAGNKDLAAQLALSLQTVVRELEENRSQLEESEKTYNDLTKAREVAVRAAKAKIEELKNLLSSIKIKEATASLNEMASGMIANIGGSGDTLNRVHEILQERHEKASGRARVAKDSIDMHEINAQEAEQKALADLALADFAAKEGIVLDAPTTGTVAPEKTMGTEGA